MMKELIKFKNSIPKQTETTKKSFQTFFKNLNPPIFTGDCIDYLEWKTKW